METPFEKRMKFLENEESDEHLELQERLKKTFYYGKIKNMEKQSLAMTELAVEYLQELVPRELGRIDMYWASSLSRDVSVTPCALMLALMYLKRLKHSNSQYLNQVSSSDLFLISVLVASKYLYDEGESDDVSNIQWACQTKTDVEDINESERAFLHALDWKIFIKPEDFWSFLLSMEQKVAWKMSLRRNSFTYTDMSLIVSVDSLHRILYDVLLELCKVIAICSAAYVGCVLTLCVSNMIPAILFSHALLPLFSTEMNVVTGIVPTVPCPTLLLRHPVGCLPIAKRVPGRSLHHVMNGKPNTNVISNPDIPQICEPWSLSWSPKVCVHASACVTVALIQELAACSCNVLSTVVLSLKSFATKVGRGIQENLSNKQDCGLCFLDILRCNQRVNGREDLGQFLSSASNRSSTCAATASNVKASEAKETKSNRQDLLYCAEGFGNLCWNDPFTDRALTSLNFSETFPSILPSSNLVQVLVY